jgi:hypothetical protein
MGLIFLMRLIGKSGGDEGSGGEIRKGLNVGIIQFLHLLL